jgi:23S rRNA (guanine2445-N2)-methyltransferase / 23S rRNA (guanine2069-N7)-methyltransferase
VVTNPPYGERMGEARDLQPLYSTLGAQLKARAPGWTAYVLAGSDELGQRLGLRAARRLRVYNGAIPCRLLELPIAAPKVDAALVDREAPEPEAGAGATGRTMLANRLRKNVKKLSPWLRREGITCYRAYDADLPEYAVAVDRYEQWVVVQEYEPPAEIPPGKAARRLHDVLAAVPEALGVAPESLVVKLRRRQGAAGQYTRLDAQGRLERVRERDCVYWVNLSDYLDTGLFLDGRGLRARVRQLSGGRAFLNLFAYTGTATVAAARGGATGSTSVDLSSTYLDWARRNYAENGLATREHALVAADCREWLTAARSRYGLVLLDPPTFSNSKRMARDLDLQRDHVELIRSAVRLLTADGVLLFVSHMRRFRLDAPALGGLEIEEITAATQDPDFARGRPAHRAWLVRLRG